MINLFSRLKVIIFKDRKFRVPRIWSNDELKNFSHLFCGNIVNISAWKDIDKQGDTYKNYFSNAETYSLTNYHSDARGFQGDLENEIFLDLEAVLPNELSHKFDVVFNHTTLEHVFDFDTAFKNLCLMSKDVVIIVVPFLQEQHAEYGDFWRFTPLSVSKLFDKNDCDLIYLNFNDSSNSSIYIFAIGSKKAENWACIKSHKDNKARLIKNTFIGKKIINNSLVFMLARKLLNYFN